MKLSRHGFICRGTDPVVDDVGQDDDDDDPRQARSYNHGDCVPSGQGVQGVSFTYDSFGKNSNKTLL